MDTQLQNQKTLPKIKLSLLSVNFLKQEDSKILLNYVEKLYQIAQLQQQDLLTLKKEKEIQELKHQKYIIKFKNRVRRLFQNYAKQNQEQLGKLKHIQSTSQEIQKLIKVAQSNNSELIQENVKLNDINKYSQKTLSQLRKDLLFSKQAHADFVKQKNTIKEKAMVALKALEEEIKNIKIKNIKYKETAESRDNYINKMQTILKESKKAIAKLSTDNAELNLQQKIQSKNQNTLIIKLRQSQEAQENLEQQKQALQKLNQNISLSLNQCRQQIQKMKNVETSTFASESKKSLNKPVKKPISRVLANLYSSYSK